jgi:hypothetical protein
MAVFPSSHEVLVEDLIMKKFLWLIGAALLFAAVGCEDEHHHHGGYYGGYYGEYPHSYYGYGNGGYYRHDDDYWEHRHD